ncbi:hypothetical protein DDZ13_02550 [Coraliomargarita sinensis]|uniref:Uncharacterized protein n=1 Tax=Coraliomargarita sinensis TaxID=2174842 RepID=A0A317ZIS4_9BACT|nr:hypothetical protein [Coraliomargarita sinensis]PXA04862.1 hypothetical protein DDZ13_02550 [Coraliomargarita sinensis]
MLPYLHILIRVEDDGSLHAMGAFTSKEKLSTYQKETGLEDNQVRLDFYNGPFDEDIEVIYAGHRRWNMDRFQLGGYFKSEGEAWNWVTQEGYVSVLRIDVTYEEEKRFEKEALELYAKLQKRWRLVSYQSLVASEGADKARANITLRFYEDALESFKPKTRRDVRALYAFIVLVLLLPIAIYFYASSGPDYGENVARVSWLPNYASNVSFYRSNQVRVYEFDIKAEDFKTWAGQNGMDVQRVTTPEILSRYKAYIPTPEAESSEPAVPQGQVSMEQFQDWQDQISITVNSGMIARGKQDDVAVYDLKTQKAYYEQLINF